MCGCFRRSRRNRLCTGGSPNAQAESGSPLESTFEVVATIMEDGARYPGTTGSRFMVGIYGEDDLHDLKDDDGIPLIEAMKEYGLSGSLEGVCRRGEQGKAFLSCTWSRTKLESANTDIGAFDHQRKRMVQDHRHGPDGSSLDTARDPSRHCLCVLQAADGAGGKNFKGVPRKDHRDLRQNSLAS